MSTPTWLDTTEWPWEPRYMDVGDGRMHYVDVGQGPVVLLSHGTPTWAFEWRHVIRGLSERFRVIAPDHLGFGLSERPAADYSPEAHAARFRRFVDGLHLDRFSLVVHDYGGPFAIPTALDLASRLDRFAVLNSFMWSFRDDLAMSRTAWLAGSWLFKQFYGYLNFSIRFISPSAWGDKSKLTPALQKHYEGPFPDVDGRQRVLWALAFGLLGSSDFFDALYARRAALQAPSLILWGMKDSAFQPHQFERWKQALPHAHAVAIPEAGHWPHEEQPETVVRELLTFLAPQSSR